MILSGRLADWSVEELLQIMRITHKTASITIETVGADVVLFFVDGALVDAHSRGRADGGDPQVRIVEAVAAILDAPDGTFDIGNDVSAEAGEPLPVPDLLSAVAIWRAAEEELRASGVLDAVSIRLLHDVDGPMAIDPDVWLAVAEFAGTMTFTELEIRLGRIGAIEVVRSLRDMGILEMVAAPLSDHETPGVLDHDRVLDDEDPVDPAESDGTPEEVRADEPVVEFDGSDEGDAGQPAPPERPRREMRSVIIPAETTLVPGVLSDIRTRFRQ